MQMKALRKFEFYAKQIRYRDADRCFRSNAFYGQSNKFAFIGDQRTFQMYHEMRKFLGDESIAPMRITNTSFFENMNQADWDWTSGRQNLHMSFTWKPEIDKRFMNVLDKWVDGVPETIVIGAGLWNIHKTNKSNDDLESFAFNVRSLIPALEKVLQRSKTTKILWMNQPQVNEQTLKDLNVSWVETVTNARINEYNQNAQNVLYKLATSIPEQLVMWTSMARISEMALDRMPGGMYLSDKVVDQGVQMLLNLHCNDNMNFNDGTCCKRTDKITNLQLITISVLIGCAMAYLVKNMYIHCCYPYPKQRRSGRDDSYIIYFADDKAVNKPGPNFQVTPHDTVLWSITKLCLIMGYFYVADRTNYLLKENK